MLLGIFAAGLACAASDRAEWNAKALALYRAGNYADAEAMYRRALDGFEPGGLDRALTLQNIAVMLGAQGRYAESEKLYREALPVIEELAGPDSLAAIRAVSNLAALYSSSGNLNQAESLAQRAEAAFRDLPAATAADRSGNRQILASIYLAQHRYADGEKLLRSVLEQGGADAVTAYSNLAAAALGGRDNALAEQYARRAVEAAQRELPARHSLAAVALNNLAQACRFQGKYLEAENYYRQAIGIWEEALGAQHPDVARGLMNLAAFYHERGRETGAEDLYLRAAAILEQTVGKHSAEALVARNEIADVWRGEHRYTEAVKLSRATLTAMLSAFRDDDARLARAQFNYARLQAETHQLAETMKAKGKVKTLR